MAEPDERLAGWLREVDLGPGAERQEAIDQAAHEVANGISGDVALDLVLLAHGDSRSAAAKLVTEAVHAADQTAALRSDDLETALVAALSVVHGMETAGGATSATLALGVMNASFVGLSPAISELTGIAARALSLQSEQLRGRKSLPEAAPKIPAAIAEAGDFSVDGQPVQSEQLRAALVATEKTGKLVTSAVNSLATAMNRRLNAADEELELLWWCFGEFSDISDTPFKDVSVDAVPLILALELAQRTAYSVPLPSTRSLLARALGGRAASLTTLARAVPAALELDQQGHLPATEGNRLLPILSAAREHRDLGGNSAWTASLARWEVDPEREVSALDLAEEGAREILLAREAG